MTNPTRRAGGANYKAWFVSLLWIIHSKETRAGFATNRHCVASNRAIKGAVVGLASSSNNNNNNNNSNKNNFDDFGGSVLGEASNANDDDTGDDLAKEFFKQVRARKQDDASEADSAEEEEVDVWGLPKDLVIEEEEDEPEAYPQQLLSEAEARALNRRPFSRRREVIAGKDAATRARKFTGRRDDDDNNNMMFLDSRQRRQRQQQQGDDNVMRMMGENNLWLQQPEKAILVQAGIVLLMFIVFVVVGVTGGIGSYNDIGDATEGFEETIPDFNDSEVSVWL